jgi:putative membrane protein
MMYWGYYDGWSWILMAAMMVLFWGGVAALIVFVARAVTPGPRGSDQAMDALRRRLANGEISQEEFEKTRRVLQG